MIVSDNVESFNADQLLKEGLFFGLDYACSAIAEWALNTARPHSSLGHQTPAASPEPSPQPTSTLRSLMASRLCRLLSPVDVALALHHD